jgi:hypothetical protein
LVKLWCAGQKPNRKRFTGPSPTLFQVLPEDIPLIV